MSAEAVKALIFLGIIFGIVIARVIYEKNRRPPIEELGISIPQSAGLPKRNITKGNMGIGKAKTVAPVENYLEEIEYMLEIQTFGLTASSLLRDLREKK